AARERTGGAARRIPATGLAAIDPDVLFQLRVSVIDAGVDDRDHDLLRAGLGLGRRQRLGVGREDGEESDIERTPVLTDNDTIGLRRTHFQLAIAGEALLDLFRKLRIPQRRRATLTGKIGSRRRLFGVQRLGRYKTDEGR